MSGSLRVDTSGLHLDIARILPGDIKEALAESALIVLAESDRLVPKGHGDLENSGSVRQSVGGADGVGIVYDSVYAHWIHEHLWFQHPHGGQAKFLETALYDKGEEAINKAARSLL